jgi:hypothetical protein
MDFHPGRWLPLGIQLQEFLLIGFIFCRGSAPQKVHRNYILHFVPPSFLAELVVVRDPQGDTPHADSLPQ